MHPAIIHLTLPGKHGIIALAVVLVRPSPLPSGPVVGKKHATFPAGCNDLVLAERKSCDISERPGKISPVGSALALRTILDYSHAARTCKFQQRIHVAW